MEETSLVVDHREVKIKELLAAEETFVSEQLALGDFIIRIANNDFAIFERKTLSDLSASIIDGRYAEQKQRLLANYNARNVYYIIEGTFDFNPIDNLQTSMPKNTLISCIVNTIFRDNINVLFTKSSFETTELIKAIYNRIKKDPAKYLNKEAQDVAHPHISSKSKKVANREECYILQLCQIPDVSIKSAQAIAEKYPSFEYLLTTFRDMEESKKLKLLKEICTKDSKGKSRKISEKVAKNIVQYIL